MLKQLRVHHIILIELAEITFATGFNALSGETGSGKSAIMEAINLIIGGKTDSSLIRHGNDKGVVEAVFDIDNLPHIHHLLAEAGVEHGFEEELIVRREIYANGRSRAFINHQSVQLNFLRKVGEYLIEIVGQHANQQLLSIDHHRRLVDLYGDLKNPLTEFKLAWEKEKSIKEELNHLVQSEVQRLREIDVCQMEMEELQKAHLKEGEDDLLFEEYTRLINHEEVSKKIEEAQLLLTGERGAILPSLTKLKSIFDQLLQFDPLLNEAAQSLDNAFIELKEISHTIQEHQNHLEYNPEKVIKINDRLMLINRLKRKYGPQLQDIQAYQKKTEERLFSLENADNRIEELKQELTYAEMRTNELAKELSLSRQRSAAELEKAMTEQLRTLNMPKVEFHVVLSRQERQSTGDDRIEFYLLANTGEKLISIKDCASGGELSRLMLSLQTILAGKEQTPTMIFDEIDANIGGETALVVGEKLNEIGQQHQVLCITHFPQVAQQAKHHLQISKKEEEGRTLSIIKALNQTERHKELERMLGHSSASLNL